MLFIKRIKIILVGYNRLFTSTCKQSIISNFTVMKKKVKNERPEIVFALAKRIKEIIIERGVVQKDVAHDAGIDVENLRKYLKGAQEMKIGMLLRISQSLGLSMSELLKGIEKEIKG